ncbi:uncharacterized protein RHOBADRAFT_42605 [Rhodotorula graminis WP1]|uniref:Uncharacterized protein n=1 Tax=Rhodotorula graminis (strain WP1) TaxID=578459 RepID=A0A194SA47_RHOGW|nr:uncharacterized protein RHOBADRAFT_42605 [Rhodotorula graminis WP1]KPV76276.1 hypothetical protein RHOBADRAFT_42605 [Rhodotorula graminis WP1]
MPSAASKAANARYFDELERGASHALASELPVPPAQFHPPRPPPPPADEPVVPKRRRGPGPPRCDRSETCKTCVRPRPSPRPSSTFLTLSAFLQQVRGIQCEYIAAAPLRAAIAGSVMFANNRIEITRLRAQVALLLRVLRISDAELQYLMHRADQPEPFVLPSPWRPVRWAAPARRSSALAAVDEELPEPPVEHHESDKEEEHAEEAAVEESPVEADEAVSKETAAPPPEPEADDEPAQPGSEREEEPTVEPEEEKEPTPPPPPTPASKRKRKREPEPEPTPEPSRRRSQRFMPKVEEPEEQKPKKEEQQPRRRSSRLKGA